MRYLLVDNGSLRAESVLNLRRVARELGHAAGVEIIPASLLHSSKVPAEQLEGEPAVNLERRLRGLLEAGDREFTLIPFFFGPTGAIMDYLPQRLAALRERHGDFRLWRTGFVAGDGDGTMGRRGPMGRMGEAGGSVDLVEILVARVREVLADQGWVRPRVALVDHGSPLREVTAVRDTLAARLEESLGDEVEAVAAASMERRDGDEYAFNEPLLERLLDQPGWCAGNVVVAMLFLSPGRHAGPGGDVAGICAAARERHPGLRTCMTGLVGDHPAIVPLLQRRLEGRLEDL